MFLCFIIIKGTKSTFLSQFRTCSLLKARVSDSWEREKNRNRYMQPVSTVTERENRLKDLREFLYWLFGCKSCTPEQILPFLSKLINL